jgi:protein-S-isoprenylcysteine O-methyltransferase Ste14
MTSLPPSVLHYTELWLRLFMDETAPPKFGFSDLVPQFKSLRYWAQVLVIAVVYLVAAKVGLSFASLNQNVSPVWPPSGVAIAAVVLFGMRVWPGVLLGALVANSIFATGSFRRLDPSEFME